VRPCSTGVARAEALLAGLHFRCLYTVVDFLRHDDILGPNADASHSDAAPAAAATAPPPCFASVDNLAKHFSVGRVGVSAEVDEAGRRPRVRQCSTASWTRCPGARSTSRMTQYPDWWLISYEYL
jgi:hypothetical protein